MASYWDCYNDIASGKKNNFFLPEKKSTKHKKEGKDILNVYKHHQASESIWFACDKYTFT